MWPRVQLLLLRAQAAAALHTWRAVVGPKGGALVAGQQGRKRQRAWQAGRPWLAVQAGLAAARRCGGLVHAGLLQGHPREAVLAIYFGGKGSWAGKGSSMGCDGT